MEYDFFSDVAMPGKEGAAAELSNRNCGAGN
jgi:hypothetical protein